MNKPYTRDILNKIIAATTTGSSDEEIILGLVDGLCDEYYDAGYQQGREDALSVF